MRPDRRRPWKNAPSALLVLAAIAATAWVAAGPGDEAGSIAPLHADTEKVEQAYLESVRAFLHQDLEAALEHLGAIEKLSRRLAGVDEPAFGSAMVNYDTAFHMTLDRTRELTRRGEFDAAFDQFVFVQRACVACHRIERPAAGD